MKTEFKSLFDYFKAVPDEQAAVDYFRSIRWANGEFCPHCGHDKVYAFSTGRYAGRMWKCGQCRERFTMKTGTIFEESNIPLRTWFAAVWCITNHKKGIASTTLAADLGITQKSAWFLLHRLRHAARTRSFNRPLRGTVEVDESYFGGKEKNKHKHKKGKDKKVLAFGMLERGGELRVKTLDSQKQVRKELFLHVKIGAKLMTDEWVAYTGLHKVYDHQSVAHGAGEYSKGDGVHINSIEGVWSIFKRQVYGIHHWVSKKHLDRYLSEATWRYNRRGLEAVSRMNEFLTRVDGRLTYNSLIQKA